MDLGTRRDAAQRIADEAGALALGFFRRRDSLKIDRKGDQDFVSHSATGALPYPPTTDAQLHP